LFEIVLIEAQNNEIQSPGFEITSQIMCFARTIIYILNSQMRVRKVGVKWPGNFPCTEQFVREELASWISVQLILCLCSLLCLNQ